MFNRYLRNMKRIYISMEQAQKYVQKGIEVFYENIITTKIKGEAKSDEDLDEVTELVSRIDRFYIESESLIQ